MPTNGQPRKKLANGNSRLRLGASGGFSHPLSEMINAIKRTKNAKKSYMLIGNAPSQGLSLDRPPCDKHLFGIDCTTNFRNRQIKRGCRMKETFLRQPLFVCDLRYQNLKWATSLWRDCAMSATEWLALLISCIIEDCSSVEAETICVSLTVVPATFCILWMEPFT